MPVTKNGTYKPAKDRTPKPKIKTRVLGGDKATARVSGKAAKRFALADEPDLFDVETDSVAVAAPGLPRTLRVPEGWLTGRMISCAMHTPSSLPEHSIPSKRELAWLVNHDEFGREVAEVSLTGEDADWLRAGLDWSNPALTRIYEVSR